MGINFRNFVSEKTFASAVRYNLVDAVAVGVKKNGDLKLKKSKIAMGSVDFDDSNIDSIIDFAKSLDVGENGEDKVFNLRQDLVTSEGLGKVIVHERTKDSVLHGLFRVKQAIEQAQGENTDDSNSQGESQGETQQGETKSETKAERKARLKAEKAAQMQLEDERNKAYENAFDGKPA